MIVSTEEEAMVDEGEVKVDEGEAMVVSTKEEAEEAKVVEKSRGGRCCCYCLSRSF